MPPTDLVSVSMTEGVFAGERYFHNRSRETLDLESNPTLSKHIHSTAFAPNVSYSAETNEISKMNVGQAQGGISPE